MIERKRFIKFLGVISNKCNTWKDPIRSAENKTAKNIGLLHRAKQLLNTSSLKSIDFSYIYRYLNYASIAWACARNNKLKTTNITQNHFVRIIFHGDRLCHLWPLLKNLDALNIYQLNIYQNLSFMHRLKKRLYSLDLYRINEKAET